MTKQDVHKGIWIFRRDHPGIEPGKLIVNPSDRVELLNSAEPYEFEHLADGREKYMNIYLEVKADQPIGKLGIEA